MRQHGHSYFGTMAGRLFVLLLVGVIGSATLALAMADARRTADLHHLRLERVVDRLADFISLADRSSEPLRAELLENGVTGIREASGREQTIRPDPEVVCPGGTGNAQLMLHPLAHHPRSRSIRLLGCLGALGGWPIAEAPGARACAG